MNISIESLDVKEIKGERYIKEIHQLFRKEWWTSNRSLSDTEKLVNASTLKFGMITPNSELIGFTRVLTDFKDTAIILDVIIKSDCRNKGLGSLLLKRVLEHDKIKNVDKIDLHCKSNLTDFYRSLSFIKNPNDMIWMRRKR